MALIAHYKLDGNTDDALGGPSGTPVNVSWSEGKLGTGAKTTGSNSWINLGNSLKTRSNSPISICGWVKYDSFTNRDVLIVRNKPLKAGPPYTWIFGTINGNLMSAYTGTVWRDVSYNFSLNTWYHLCFSFDGSILNYYVNGSLIGTRSDFSYSSYDDHNAQIGGYSGTTGDVNGITEDVRIYDHALSAREVRDLAQAKILHYSFNQFQEPTENLIPIVEQWNTQQGWSSFWASQNKTIEKTDLLYDGVYVIKSVFNESRDGGPAYRDIDLGGSGITCMVSAKVKSIGRRVRFWISDADGAQYSDYNVADGKWYHIESKAKSRSDNKIRIHFRVESGSAGDIVWCTALQVEIKSKSTPFANGTREGIIRDCSGRGNDAILSLSSSPAWVEDGILGKGCYDFSKGSDAIFVDDSEVNYKDGFTVSAWVYRRSSGGNGYGRIVSKENGIGPSGGFTLYHDIGKIRAAIPGGTTIDAASTINKWEHWTYSVDSSNSARLYRDGVLMSSSTQPLSGIVSTLPLAIGNIPTNAVRNWDGLIDDVRIYKSSLSADEVKELYQQRASLDSHGNFYTGLINEHNEFTFQKTPAGSSHNGSYGLYFSVSKDVIINSGVVRPYFSGDVTFKLYDFDSKRLVYETEEISVINGIHQRIQLNIPCRKGVKYWLSPEAAYGNWMRTDTGDSFLGTEDVFTFETSRDFAGTTADRWYYLFDIYYSVGLSIEQSRVRQKVSEVGITEGLVAYYPFRNDADDYSGNGHHGTVHGAMPAAGIGKYGAYRFDGYPRYIAGLGSYTDLKKFTYSSWINRSVNQDNFIILGARQGNNSYISMAVIGNRACLHKYGFNSNSDLNVAVGGTPIGTGVWRHLVITYDEGVTKTYVDGMLDGSGTHVNTSYSPYPMQINYDNSASDSYRNFKGSIGPVKIFNRALSPAEIALEYKIVKQTKMSQLNGKTYLQGSLIEN